jgi:hypothetical protein
MSFRYPCYSSDIHELVSSIKILNRSLEHLQAWGGMGVLLWCMGGVALSDFLCSLEKRYRGAVILESRQTS